MNVLTPLQRDFLPSFFAQPASAPFALHSGTALAAFYLHHRVSEDVDLYEFPRHRAFQSEMDAAMPRTARSSKRKK